MKTLQLLFAASALAISHTAQAKEITQVIQAHEWGTLTTLSTSDGAPLAGLFIDASPLPAFVNSLPFFEGAPAPLFQDMSYPPGDSNCAAKWQGVMTKMETPVLYFYSDGSVPIPVEVKARFPGGTIHQFYPPRQGGEANPSGDHVDFDEPREGRVEWQAQILPQKLSESTYAQLSHPGEGVTQEWQAPRRPQSNLVKAGGEIESYLFYRGLAGQLDLPLQLRFTGDSTLILTNAGSDSIAHVVVYDQTYSPQLMQAGVIWWQGALGPRETRTLRLNSATLPGDFQGREQAFQAMKTGQWAALQKAGLTEDEAAAMLSTWERSYWGDEKGFKVFWILPRRTVDALVPLTLTSDSAHSFALQRVFIVRSEILMPEFERSLRQGLAVDIRDRHRIAFKALASTSPLGIRYPLFRSRSNRAHQNSSARFFLETTSPSSSWVLPNGRKVIPH